MRVIDVEHLGRPHVIGCWEVDGVLVDPGPESSLRPLLEAIGDEQPRASCSPTSTSTTPPRPARWSRRWPDLEVYVHERGAPHLIDPSKLLASAERLYGDQLEYLWGEILPVPEANVTVLAAARPCSGCASPTPPATPPTTSATCTRRAAPPSSATSPPAASRPRTWSCPRPRRRTSTSRSGRSRSDIVEGWEPERLALTHFGPIEDAGRAPRDGPRRACARRPSWPARCPRTSYEADLQRRIASSRPRRHGEETVAELLQAVPTAYQWRGLDRYWRKKAEREAASLSA